ncbi:antiviral reverse transcriptase Drt3b [Herbaspirillum camelliae]|uniref:antiviral reverse transcriptase Drt3b n=1 Tax=Herbaspirillum camelliae TaxID=1892903 RepID=UPI000949EB7E|nr:antiviral reverse transcriptase Drt3b [Herbaspirillum camelliae]
MKKQIKIKKTDYNRILITETLPYETPIIFSNDGIYDRINSVGSSDSVQRIIVRTLILGEEHPSNIHSTIPYSFKIKKNSTEFRRLALLHPCSQWKVKQFYEKYERLILHYCSESPASIRAPQKVASTFYNKSSWENVHQYKSGSVSLAASDRYAKHAPSYFSYRGFDRLYKFFNSREYFSLEKSFSVLRTLDVAKCFDSIYTHCLSWAVKDKAFTKESVAVSSTFAQEFDQTIRHGNHNETNGIPIGPEFSRIFAEILFQKIDRLTVAKLKDLRFGINYTFRRYVDDVFIFADSEATANAVYEVYADQLMAFNLHGNNAKSITYQRPFVTPKSRLIHEAGRQANEFIEKFLEDNSMGVFSPKPIRSPWNLTKNYIESVKSLCSYSAADYDEVASFLISVFTERVKKLVGIDSISETDETSENLYLHAIEVLLDVLFFLYSVAPSVRASYKLSTALILSIRFFKKNCRNLLPTISERVYELSYTLLLDQCDRSHANRVDGFVHLECLNVALAMRELGGNYLLPEEVIRKLFIDDKHLSYFTIVSCLYYFQDDPRYTSLRGTVLDRVKSELTDLSDILVNSERAYLFLDMLSCPSIAQIEKENWIKSYFAVIKKAPPSRTDLNAFFTVTGKSAWQVSWTDVDLLNSLEKKELKQAY